MKNSRILSLANSLLLLSVGSVVVLAAYSANATQKSTALPTFPEEETSDRAETPPLAAPAVSQPPVPDVTPDPKVETADPIAGSGEQEALNDANPDSSLPESDLELFGQALDASEWNQAKSEELSLREIRRTHVRFLDPTGSLNGRISVAGESGENLFFESEYTLELVQKGRVVRAAKLMPNGRFSFEGLSKGPYGVFLRGGTTMLSYSLYLGDEIDLQQANYSQKEIAFIYASHSSKLKDLVLPLLSFSTPRGDYPAIRELVEGRIQESESTLPVQYHQNQLYIPQKLDLTKAIPGTSLSEHKIHLLPNGDMIGRTRKIVFLTNRNKYAFVSAADVEINLIRNNQIVAKSRTNAEGVFRVKSIEPGFYSVVAYDAGSQPQIAGSSSELNRDGFGIIGIEAVPYPENVLAPKRPTADESIIDQLNYVSTLQENTQEVAQPGPESPLFLDLGLAELPPDVFEEEPAPFEPAPLAGGFGGGGGGAAGGGMGGFLPGLLLGLTPFLFDDDDQSPIAP